MTSYLVVVDLVEYICVQQSMMISKARLIGNDTALLAILASDDPRDQKRPGTQVRHFHHELWQIHCEGTVLRGNRAKFSQKEDMSLALDNTVDICLAKAIPHKNVWGIGLNAFDLRAALSVS